MPGKGCPHMDLLVTVENITVCPSPTARNLCGTGQSVMLHRNDHRRGSILQICTLQHPQYPSILVEAPVISRLDYCNSLLAGLPASAIKPLQRIQNAAARLVLNLHKFSHGTSTGSL